VGESKVSSHLLHIAAALEQANAILGPLSWKEWMETKAKRRVEERGMDAKQDSIRLFDSIFDLHAEVNGIVRRQ
jgi:hypothetical protein